MASADDAPGRSAKMFLAMSHDLFEVVCERRGEDPKSMRVCP